MGSSQVPAASIPASNDKWVQIATSSPITGTQVSFTSISGYKKLYVLIEQLTNATGGNYTVTINNDTGAKYYNRYLQTSSNTPNFSATGSTSAARNNILAGLVGAAGATSSHIIIDNADSATIKEITGSFYQVSANTDLVYLSGTVYKGTATISSIQVNGAGNFTAGTVTLYGVLS
jgi:hypothetical protein